MNWEAAAEAAAANGTYEVSTECCVALWTMQLYEHQDLHWHYGYCGCYGPLYFGFANVTPSVMHVFLLLSTLT
jgi:hypothetical protein